MQETVRYLKQKGATLESYASIVENSIVRYTGIGDNQRDPKITEDRLEKLSFLLEEGYDPNAKTFSQHISYYSGNSYLTDAATKQNYQIMDLLIEHGADVNHRNRNGSIAWRDGQNTALHIILANFHKQGGFCRGCGEKFWQEKREKLNKQVGIAKATIEKLLAHNADVTIKNYKGQTALEVLVPGPKISRGDWIDVLLEPLKRADTKLSTENSSDNSA